MLTIIRYGDGIHDVTISSYEEDDVLQVALDISSQEGTAKVKLTEEEARMFCTQLTNFLGEASE